jgi:hypothetical protein
VTAEPVVEEPVEADPGDVLLAELAGIRDQLRGGSPGPASADGDPAPLIPRLLDHVAAGFGLSAFERSVLLLAAGPELVGEMAAEIAAVAGVPHPSFGLALRVLPGAHWSAVRPTAPLRRWHLVRLLDPTSPTRSPLVVDERVLHHLLGVGYLDPDVAAITRPAEPLRIPAESLVAAAAAVATAWEEGNAVLLRGPQRANLAPVAAAAARALGRTLLVLSAADLPRETDDRERLLRLLEREAVLGGTAWAVDVDEDPGAPQAAGWLLRALPRLEAPVVALGSAVDAAVPGTVRVEVPRLTAEERVAALTVCLGRNGRRAVRVTQEEVVEAAAVFDLPVGDLDEAATAAVHGRPLWQACRERSRQRFDGLARLVEPRASWDDLVLPPGQTAQLRGLVETVRHRSTVNDRWGFASRSSRGLGTAALFAGPSGTGKTLAAEVVARELELDLVVIDLSQVVSKYIGDTEKNLARVFDAAEDSGAVLLFDEADALFGKRTEVRDSHDRYANLEVGYLLQRVESFRGLAILTTNARAALDPAFLRRLRVVVSFPYPSAVAREEMWRRAFPAATPTAGLDCAALAAIDLPGGGIAAAALTAAYLGAERGEVTAEDVAAATRWELAKHGRTSTSR